ncbi:Uncharacterized protein family UPF0546 [Penicillium griseofulvum]|uniref:Uncharacterized protein family UPF0546 n=1 Tax=Penicillium patulum TaxID=5078 RepID=A0A135LAD5_PENPA|nr:Uncharacterized protein family UPF0546 [Penicillium griseofulvum]KXG45938.1 Uncharacterized protein family UPF0546 [Penicillium griseofulvum]
MDPDTGIPEPEPSVFNYVLSFLLVGVAWGFTTPFIRRAAADFNARQEKANKSNYSGRGRGHSQEPETVFTDAGEEQELLSRGAQDSDSDEEGVRRRSTSSSDVNRKPKAAGADTGLDVGIAGQSGSGGISEAREGSADEEQDDLPSPAWRRGAPMKQSWLRTKIVSIFWTVVNLLRTPAYAIPLVINLTGSIWFFLLVGKHGLESLISYYIELSLTVPLANSSAFLFTVLGEWYVDRKVIAKETWLGMGLVLGGIALCVHSKNQAS